MNELSFWKIIEQTKEKRRDFSHQIELITSSLVALEENHIIEFEYRLREILDSSAYYSLMAAAKIVTGFVSDDSFLYFRCRLIAEGKKFFYNAIENPDIIEKRDIQDLEYDGEDMLYVADNAFILKFGENTDKELPRDIAMDYLDYNNLQGIKGEDWVEEELPFKYPNLCRKYNQS